jgi:hypothetical protein
MFPKLLVATLALGSRPKQGLVKVRAKCEAWESDFMLSRVWRSVREWTPTFPSELLFWELKSQWTPKFLESDYKINTHWIKEFLISLESV